MDIQQTIDELRDELVQTVQAASRDEIAWSWVAKAVARILHEHSTGVSRTVLLTELESQWYAEVSSDLNQSGVVRTVAPFFHNAGSTAPPESTVFGLKINNTWKLKHTDFWIWQVSGAPDPENAGSNVAGARDLKKRNTADKQADLFVHQRYYPMLSACEFDGFFSNMRTMLATRLSIADRGGGASGFPVRTLLPTTSLAFVLRLKDDQNLSKLLRRHTDEALMRDIFGVEYTGTRFRKCGQPAFSVDQIWCKVEAIHMPQMRMHDGRKMHVQEVECFYEQNTAGESQVVVLEFWDADMAMVRLFNSGDYLGLLCPNVLARDAAGVPTRVDYGANAIAFCMKGISRYPSTSITQTAIARNDLGFFDYSNYAHRVRLSELCSDIMHLDLLAHVKQISHNLPFSRGDDGEEDRYVVKLEDASVDVERDVTLWGELSSQCTRFKSGHLVLLTNLETNTEGEPGDSDLKINGSIEIDSTVFNLSTLPGMLTSPGLRTYTSLAALPSKGSRFIKARVTKTVAAPTGLCDARDRLQATTLVHDACGWPVGFSSGSSGTGTQEVITGPTDMYVFDCTGCRRMRLPEGEVVSAFSICANVDDGTAVRETHVDALAASRLLVLTAVQFLELPSAAEQTSALARAVGKEIVSAVSMYADLCDQTNAMRIDVLCPAEDVGVTDDI